MMSPLSRHVARAMTLTALVGATACNSDKVTGPVKSAAGTFTVDARNGFVYVALGDSSTVTPTPAAAESPAWDIAFFATNVTLNGGQAGPGGVTGYCLCQNSAQNPSASQWLAMTPSSEQADFDTLRTVPGNATFVSDNLAPAITGWFAGTGASAAAVSDAVYLVRLSDSSGVAKVRVTSLQAPTATHAGRVTLEYAVASNTATAFGTPVSVTVDLSTGAKTLDLQTGQVVTNAQDWDLRFDGFTARVNGGVSGPGKGGAARLTGVTFANATPTSTAANALRIDNYTGVFGSAPFYKYNLGGDNRITPTFDVYLLKRGSAVYKLQVTGYYSATGAARFITFRYAQLAP